MAGGGSRGRTVVWGAAALMLLPLLATLVTDEVKWDVADLAIFGAILAAACGIFELAASIKSWP